MSWNVGAVGKAAAVKRALATQFENAKQSTQHIQPEQSSVIAIEAAINSLLYNMDQSIAVKVSASGSCGARDGILGSASITVQFETLYGFVE